jgi:hypothetical protein
MKNKTAVKKAAPQSSFQEWLKSVPASGETITVNLSVTMEKNDWATIAQMASNEGISFEQAVTDILYSSVEDIWDTQYHYPRDLVRQRKSIEKLARDARARTIEGD